MCFYISEPFFSTLIKKVRINEAFICSEHRRDRFKSGNEKRVLNSNLNSYMVLKIILIISNLNIARLFSKCFLLYGNVYSHNILSEDYMYNKKHGKMFA